MAPRTLRLALRGSASEGADEIVAQALAEQPGIAGIRTSMMNNVLEVDYEDERSHAHGDHGLASTERARSSIQRLICGCGSSGSPE